VVGVGGAEAAEAGGCVSVELVPVATPAGGLTRVVLAGAGGSGGHDIILLDSSYPGGTAPCSLLEKLAWKLGDPATRGPPPFKGA
jgi:hypothetical protein